MDKHVGESLVLYKSTESSEDSGADYSMCRLSRDFL